MVFPTDSNVIVGMDRADDAGVYKITDDIAIIQTVDFFTPIVDDPYWFGQIAAANALSDVYAMGGVPKTAMNIVGFPLKDMDISVLRQILQGGLEKMKEAGVFLVGGHSVEDKELKYGLSVTGLIHPDRILTKKALKLGDRLILTKPLGTGIINTAIKGGLASSEIIDNVTHLMAALNKDAAEIMQDFPVHACTDITGFGLLGHLAEMVVDSEFGVEIQTGRIPFLPEAVEYAAMGLLPAGLYKNREFREAMVDISPSVDPFIQDILFDPQTSGGLLICVDRASADDLLDTLKEKGMDKTEIIGDVWPEPKGRIVVN
ncbi:MAG: selenide, water dikinase SelD [Desulfobacterales bacterium C00003060]|nr:MAG: selenide, water dikinase SelD [Desulfobacterales bacterium S3730MH5]OEU77478.1 MAG: selenide, water dikinase SelD [Desulfobacterales bacterium C00003060]OEU78379.1 MAG: selenide, water dikinase SelD [Desulfobacterales bacterium S5133MH4]